MITTCARTITARRSLVHRAPQALAVADTTSTTSTCTSTSTCNTLWRFQSDNSKANVNKNSNDDSPSLFESAAETYASLRWKFASSLTQSLSKEEQSKLLGRLTVKEEEDSSTRPSKKNGERASQETNSTAEEKDKTMANKANDTMDKPTMSIAEAVAAARLEEAQKQKSQFEQEKAKLLADAEAAAQARVENELLIQRRQLNFERWQRDLKKEEESRSSTVVNSTENKSTAGTDSPASSSMVVEAEVTEEETLQQEQPTENLTEEPPVSIGSDHPVLGSAIADLGYKRVHVTSVASLKSLPIWQKQRAFRHKRAQSMASDKMKSLHLGLPGIIALHEVKKKNCRVCTKCVW